MYLLTPDTRRQMMPLQVEFEPGARLAEPGRHAGEEWVLVVEGELRLELEGAEPRILEPGDAAYYPAERPHLFANASKHKPLRADLRRHAADDVMAHAERAPCAERQPVRGGGRVRARRARRAT